MGKRILSLLLSVIMILSLAPVTFAASETENISIVSSKGTSFSAKADDTFTVTLRNKEMTVSSFAAGINFDKDKLEVTEIIGCYDYEQSKIIVLKPDGSMPISPTATPTVSEANTNGVVSATFAGSSDTKYKAADIFTVTFKVKSNVSGEAKITMFENSAGTSGYNADPIETGAVTVNVVIPATGITLDKTTLEIDTRGSATLVATVEPNNTTDTVTWESSNTDVATVNENGLVTPVAVGATTITATAGSVNATCTVNVVEHVHNVTSWTKANDTQHKGTCATCNEEVYKNHIAGDGYQHNATQHNKVCTICHNSYALENHTYERKILVTSENCSTLTIESGASVTDSDYHVYKCDVCAHIEKTAHTAGNTYGHNDTQHWKLCSVCGQQCANAENHTFSYSPERSNNTNHVFICGCGATKSGAHDPADAWINNTEGTTHWHGCKTDGCEYHCDEAEHVYDQEEVKECYLVTGATCTSNAIYYKSCVCEKAGTETFEAAGTKLPHKTTTTHQPRPATCLEDGVKAYYTCECGANFFTEENGTQNPIPDLTAWQGTNGFGNIPKLEHEAGEEENVAQLDPTCTAAGHRAYFKCKNGCGEYYYIDDQNKPVKIGDASALETWKTEGNYGYLPMGPHGAGATGVNCPEEPATCTTDGVKAYFKCGGCSDYFYDNNGTITKIDNVETWKAGDGKLAALRHSYSDPTYSWDGNQCTATRTCTRTGCTSAQEGHTITETKTGTYVKDTDATCTTAETGHYEVTFTDTQFGSDSTDENSVTNGNPLGHSYGTPVYEWNGDLCTAKKTCTREGCTNAQEGHIITETKQGTYVEVTPATCVAASTGYYEVEFTGESFTKQTENHNGKNPALGHNYSNEWTSDEIQHWHKCLRSGCTDTTVPVAHNYTTFKGSDATTHTYECVCGKTETVDHNHNGNGRNLKKDETGHWYVCSCGYEKLDFEAHTFDTNDCTKAGTCTKCGYVRPAGTHSWGTPEQTKAPTCTTAGTNKYTCTSCQATETRDDIPALGHVLEGHSLAATCTAAGYKTYYTCTRDVCTCKDNYYTDSALTASIGDGTALDTWKGSTGAGYIAALGHSFTLTSSKAATCDVNGEKVYTCDRCKETKTEVITAHHTYNADGVCTGCGKTLTPENVTKVETAVGEVKSGKGENAPTVNTPAMEILNAVAGNDMPKDIVEEIANGATLTVTFEVKKKNENEAKIDVSVAESYEEKVKETSEKGKDNGKVEISAPIDIDLSMILNGDAQGTEIHNLSKPIEIAVPVPEDIQEKVQAASGKVIEYFMLRIHEDNGTKEVKVLNAWIDKDGKYCFDTDKLSTFVPMIVVSDPEPEERPHSHGDTIVISKRDTKEEKPEAEENPNTGAEVPNFGIALVVLGAACVVASKKRK